MNRRLAIRTLAAAGAGLFSHLRATQPPTDPQEFILHSDVRLVLLDASVMDHQGAFVSGLIKDNFSIFEDGHPQPISVFDHSDLPVTCGLIVDESRSMTTKRRDVLSAASAFIEASNPQDEIFVLNFNDTVKPGLPESMLFSDDLTQLRGALYRGLPEGKTALYDAVVRGLDQLELGKQDKKTLIVVSDGGDNSSVQTRRQMFDRVQRSVATIYAIGLYDPDDMDRDLGVLKDMAHISGGVAYFPSSPPETIPVCQRIAKDIRSRYTLGYHPEPGKTRLRHIDVKVVSPDHGRLNIRTRRSYIYEDSSTSSNRPAAALD